MGCSSVAHDGQRCGARLTVHGTVSDENEPKFFPKFVSERAAELFWG